MADVLAHPHGLSGRLRALRAGWRLLADIVSQARSVSDIFENKDTGTGAISDPGGRASGWVEVILDEHGKAVLRSRRTRLGLPAGTRDQVTVRLERTGDGRVHVYVDTDHVGTLAPADGRRYLAAMAAPPDHLPGRLLTLGLATITADSEPALRIAPHK